MMDADELALRVQGGEKLIRGLCANCDQPVVRGPAGGNSLNLLCYHCGMRFNVMFYLIEVLPPMSESEMQDLKELYPPKQTL